MAKITKGDIYNFVKENLVTANNERLACGDGRYEKEESEGAIRAFGADFGIVMALAATLKDNDIKVSPDNLVSHYVEAKRKLLGDDAVIDYHCDTHNHEEGNIGCGHIKHASDPKNNGRYGSINALEVQELFLSFTENPASKLTILKGEHKEEGVLFVHSKEKTISSRNKKGRMFFVVDKDRVDDYIEKITYNFTEGLSSEISVEQVKKNYYLQMSTTAEILGADKKPHYKIYFDQNKHLQMDQLPKKKAS